MNFYNYIIKNKCTGIRTTATVRAYNDMDAFLQVERLLDERFGSRLNWICVDLIVAVV